MRRFLVMIHLALVATFLVREQLPAAERPNILFLFADDWGRVASIFHDDDSAGGLCSVVRTPHFDRLAREGVLFRHAFVNAPSCTPCRSSLLSGQYFWRTGRGAILQGAVWDAKIPTWPLLLHDGGYHLGKSFKVWSPGTPSDAPYGGQKFAYQQAGGRANDFSEVVAQLVADGKTFTDAQQELLAEVRGNFAACLAARPKDSPFCYWYGPTNVHRAWQRGSGLKLWGIDPDQLQRKLPPFLPDVPEVRADVADYLGEIQAWDAAVGVLLDELKKSGEYENTLIVMSGDHGPPGFPHGKCNLYDFGTRVSLAISGPGVRGGRVVDDFVSLPDLAPTLLEAAGVTIPEAMTARSLWPVLRSDKSGLVDPERSFVLTGRERHVEMAREGYLPYPQRAIRTAEYLYIINFKPERYPLGNPYRLEGDNPPTFDEIARSTIVTLPDEDTGPTKAWLVTHRSDEKWRPLFEHAYGRRPREELFDLKSDPHQMHNVAAETKYAQIRAELEKKLLAELRRTKDPRVIEDGKYFETPPLAGPLPKDVPQKNRRVPK